MDTSETASTEVGTTAEALAPEPAPSRPSGLRGSARLVAPVIAALLVGGGAVFAIDHGSSGPSASARTAAGLGVPGDAGAPGGAGGPGGLDGERHVQGTVTGTNATSVTVKSSSGTATYTVNALTQIVRNGRTASLSSIQAGDPVLVHVYPGSSGQMLVERLFAGTSASGGDGFGPPGANGAGGPSGPSGV